MEIIQNFIVFEGADGSGTTTQVSMLADRLKLMEKPSFFPVFEPTDSPIGRLIRCALKNEVKIKPQTLAYLFAADRNEHIFGENGIAEHAKKGSLVVSDRYALSSLVYQGIECGDDLPSMLNSRFPMPELTFFLDIDPQIAQERMKERSSLEIYEYREFQEKVREKYLSLVKTINEKGSKVITIDASKSAQEVSLEVWSNVSSLPIFKV